MMGANNTYDEVAAWLEREIVPRYDAHDAAHRRDHARWVMAESQRLAEHYPQADRAMLLVAAAYHDLGLCEGREHHHEASARILRADERLRRWFTPEQIQVMADAAEDHRASSKREPRTIYGRLVAEADRQIDAATVIRRTIQYGLGNYPHLGREEHYQRMLAHLREKYGPQGYLHLYIPESPNAQRLAELRAIIACEPELRRMFGEIYGELAAAAP